MAKHYKEVAYLKEIQTSLANECIGCSDRKDLVGPLCAHVDLENLLCTRYAVPTYWWEKGRRCPLATHWVDPDMKLKQKIRVGQQKQKKRR